MIKKFVVAAAGALTLATFAGLPAAVPSAAAAPPATVVNGYGWVWNDVASPPLGVEQTPSRDYQFSSSWRTNTVTRNATGNYTVKIAGVNAFGGTAHATAYGGGTQRCKVGSWGPGASDQYVTVNCQDRYGNPVDSRFTVSYTSLQPLSSRKFAYLWWNGSWTPSTYQFNSSGSTNTVAPMSTGVYSVTLPGLATTGGTVQVTAYGGGNEWCKVADLYASITVENVEVRCFTPTGDPAHAQFTLTFVDGGNIVGHSDHDSAYALVDPRWAPSIATTWRYSWPFGSSTPFSVSGGAGVYTVTVPPRTDTGTVHVTAQGFGSESCGVVGWSTGGIVVKCYDRYGSPVDTPFLVAYMGAYVIP
jgi:hypothetical protein